MKKLEFTSQDAAFDRDLLDQVKKQLAVLKTSEDPAVQRLSEIEKHLHAGMSLRHFVSFVIPLERILSKSIDDGDFLIAEKDGQKKSSAEPLPLVFVLDNIRSAFNVGSILRTAECLWIEKVYLCGYTATPEQDKVLRTALGTEKFIPWESATSTLTLLQDLSSQGYQVIALETAHAALPLTQFFLQKPTALVVGNERFGLSPDILKVCHEIRRIPLRGQKNSLNVGVSLAVSGFEWLRQWQQR